MTAAALFQFIFVGMENIKKGEEKNSIGARVFLFFFIVVFGELSTALMPNLKPKSITYILDALEKYTHHEAIARLGNTILQSMYSDSNRMRFLPLIIFSINLV